MHKFTLIYNANIITMNRNQPKADAIVFSSVGNHQGRIIAIGEKNKLVGDYGSISDSVDLKGKTILPGLTDAHIHLRYYALGLEKLNLFGKSKQAIIEIVKERALQIPENEWILGHGWNQNDWEDGFGFAQDLDSVTPNHAVFLTATSLHAAWVNQRALDLARVTSETNNPPNGEISRNSDGQPNGVLFETAMELVSRKIPKPSQNDTQIAILTAQEELWKYGITSVHDFDRRESFIALQSLHKKKNLKLRVLKHLPVELLDSIIDAGLRSNLGDEMLRIGGIKVFADGALGPHTAAMLAPYEGEENKGMLFLDGEEFFEIGKKASNAGLSMTVHAIGDAANHEMLNGYQQLRKFEKENHRAKLRHRIEHAQILHAEDFARFANLDIIASMQPIHAIADMDIADKYWGERSKYSYAWNQLLEKGVKLAFGSDAPVDTPNPFYGIHAAISRTKVDDISQSGWYPEQCLSLQHALEAYTIGAAYTANQENSVGQLKTGFLADFIVLENNPFELSASEIREIQPLGTLLGGEWVYRNKLDF